MADSMHFEQATGRLATNVRTVTGIIISACGALPASVGREVKTGIPVYNDVEIDAAKIVWARDMGEKYNAELLQYFRDR